ncbi:hypothetical protein ACFQ9Z_16255 [Streptomyces sp. NPDC056580]
MEERLLRLEELLFPSIPDLAMLSVDVWQGRPSVLDEYKPYLDDR